MITAIALFLGTAAAMLVLILEDRARRAAERGAAAALQALVEANKERDEIVETLTDRARTIERATVPAIQAVRLAQWAGPLRGTKVTCPICEATTEEGHVTSCAIRTALVAAEGK